jgi:hypothetical protein
MLRINLTQAAVARLLPHPAKHFIDYWDTKLPGFGVRVMHETAAKSWVAHYVVKDGRQVAVTIAPMALLPDVEVARVLARASINRARRGIDQPVVLRRRPWPRRPHAAERLRYWQQKGNARQRGIEFRLNFDEWLSWWRSTGRFAERGKRRSQYVMARPGDVGAYELGNIECMTGGQNLAQGKRPVVNQRGIKNPRVILTVAQVRMIRASTASTAVLALELGVSKGCVDGVRYGKNWRHILSRPR